MEPLRGEVILNLLKDKLEEQPKVLDIGCGENNLFFKFKDYVGIDIKNYGLNNIMILDLNYINSLPFKDATFDIVMATEILEHLFRPDILAMEINRVVKPDGVIIISLPNEFTLACRIGFLIGKILDKGFDLYTHKYIFNKKTAEKFMEHYFCVVKKAYVMTGVGTRYLPKSIKIFLANVFPNLFAKSIIFKCRKRL